MAGMLPEEVGLLLSPTELQEFSFDKDKADTDTVAESTSQFWKQSGVEESLFSGGNTTGASIAKSIVTDEALSSGLIKQIERNVNRIIKKYNSDTYKFKVRILPTTIFNWQDVYEKYIKAATYGLPTKMMAASALGITPNVFNNMVFLENDVMGLTEKLQPLKSSSTMSPDSEGGAPAKSDDGLSDSGQATRDKDGNNKDNRNFNLDLDEVVE
jgi:hypothetical protein